jgi:hypothetical protein
MTNDSHHVAAKTEMFQIQRQMELDKALGNTWRNIIRKKTYLRRFILAFGTAGILQCCGQQVITSTLLQVFSMRRLSLIKPSDYDPIIYGNLGNGPLSQLCFQGGYITMATVAQITSVFFVDYFNRPKFMSIGVAGFMSTLVGEAVIVSRYIGTDNTNALRAGVAMLFCFIKFFSFFLDGTQFSYMGEIFPTHLRAKGLSVGVATIW